MDAVADDAALTVRDRKLLMQRIQELGATEHEEIFKMFQARDVEYTRNSNGIFVNLTAVPDDLVRQMRRFVDFCMENKSSLDEYDKRLNECKYNQNYEYCMQGVSSDAVAVAAASAASADLGDVAEASVCVTGGGATPPAAREVAAAVAVAPPTDEYASGPGLDRAAMEKKLEHAKYAAAKKRYAKRRVQEKKASANVTNVDDVNTNDLFPEPVMLCAARA
jgi:hypothetical protein